MNILPKKRWHVRTKENIARVRRDEANAAEEEKEKQRRIQLAEQEARTNFLREQARQRLKPEDDISHVPEELSCLVPVEEKTHVNFFAAVEDGQKSWGVNKEHEQEKKEEQEKYEKSIGLLTYLGQTSLDTKGQQPWYFNSPEERRKVEGKGETEEVAPKSKTFLDPLKDVRKYLDLIEKKDPEREKPKKRAIVPTVAQVTSYVKPKKHKKHKKHSKKSHKKRNHHSSSSSDSDSDDGESNLKSKISIEQLRAERLRREKEERARTDQLLAKMRGEVTVEPGRPASPPPDGRQGYNSQFNPHLAKKPKNV